MDSDQHSIGFEGIEDLPKTLRVSLSQRNEDYILALQRQNIGLEYRLKQIEGQMSSLYKTMLSLSESNKKHQDLEDKLKSVAVAFNEKMNLVAEEFSKSKQRDTKIRSFLEDQREQARKIEMYLEKLKDKLSEQQVKMMGFQGALKELYKKIFR